MSSTSSRIVIGCIGALAIVATACDAKSGGAGSEQAYVESEVAKLEAALAARSESEVAVGCISATISLERMPAALADKIKRLCYVAAPRLHLQLAVAEVTQRNAAHPGIEDLNCIELFVGDAFKTLSAHPTTDPELLKLVEAYTRMCPAEAAKHRGKQ